MAFFLIAANEEILPIVIFKKKEYSFLCKI